MAFRLTSKIKIGKYEIRGGINNCEIRRSVRELVDTASIKIPAMGRVSGNNTNPDLSSVETSILFTEGDKVTINLGYNNENNLEFQGFVRRVEPSVPLLIECEGYAWQLRRKYLQGSWKHIKLREFLTILIKDTDIVLSDFIPDLNLTNLDAHKHPNGVKILEYLKDRCHLVAYFKFNVLYVGIEEAVPGANVKYRIGWNVVRDNNLKYRVANDTKVLIKLVTGKGKKTKRTVIEKGDKGGSTVTETICNIADSSNLEAISNRLLAHSKFNGYEGYLNGFLQPYCNPSDSAEIIDKMYSVMDGKYFVEGIEVRFGMDGAKRKVHVSRALSTPKFIELQDKNSNQ